MEMTSDFGREDISAACFEAARTPPPFTTRPVLPRGDPHVDPRRPCRRPALDTGRNLGGGGQLFLVSEERPQEDLRAGSVDADAFAPEPGRVQTDRNERVGALLSRLVRESEALREVLALLL